MSYDGLQLVVRTQNVDNLVLVQFLHVVASGEVICNLLCRRTRICHQHSRTTDNLVGITKVQTFGSNLKDMICHITECAASEIPPATEVPGSINRIVIAIFSRTYEAVPVKSVRNRVFFFRSRNSLRPNRTVSEESTRVTSPISPFHNQLIA